MKKIILAITLMCFGVLAFAHPGKTDEKGCHTNQKTGKYHCHNSKKKKAPAKKKPVAKKDDKSKAKPEDKKEKEPAKKEQKKK